MTTAASMTFDSLVTDVGYYAERSDDTSFLDRIPRLIMLAENRLASEIKGLGFQRFVNGTMEAGQPVYAKPARWRETSSFSITVNGQRLWLKQRSYAYCRTYSPDPSILDRPKFFADYDYEHFFIAATPDQAYAFELAYFERPVPLDSNNQENWTTQYAPQLLLYATLLEAQPYLKLDDRVQLFSTMYEGAKKALQDENDRRVLAADQTYSRSVS